MNDIMRYYERFALDDPNKWFRILPLGAFQRFGRDVCIGQGEIADMLANFMAGVPETGVPVKPSHEPSAGKVGDIAALECREDGLYARVSWLDRGLQILKDGAFQFFSPEIFWGEVQHEGRTIRNVLMGLALVNDPFFGKATALFSLLDQVEPYREFSPEERRKMADEGKAMPDGSFPIMTVQDLQNAVQAWGRSANQAAAKRHIIKRARALGRTDLLPSDWEGSTQEEPNMEDKKNMMDAFGEVLKTFGFTPKPAPGAVPVADTEEYKALADNNRKLEEKVAEQEKAQRVAANVAKYGTALKADKFEAPKSVPEALAAVAEFDAELADKLVTEYKALVEQAAQGKLFAEIGTASAGMEGKSKAEQFKALAEAKAAEKKISIPDAFTIIAHEQPELYTAYRKESAGKNGGEG